MKCREINYTFIYLSGNDNLSECDTSMYNTQSVKDKCSGFSKDNSIGIVSPTLALSGTFNEKEHVLFFKQENW